MTVAWTRVVTVVCVCVCKNGRTVHLFWVHAEGCVDTLNVGRKKNNGQGGQGLDNRENGFQQLGWGKVRREQVWGNVEELFWTCLCRGPLRRLGKSVGRHVSKGSRLEILLVGVPRI